MITVADIIRIQGYTIVGEPQTGGFAIVYKAKHKDGYLRAFKTPNLGLAYNNEQKEKLKADFVNECNKLLELQRSQNVNPCIIKLYDYETRRLPFYAEMEYIEGPSLQSYVESHYIPISEVYQFIEDIGSAVAFCHHHEIDDFGYTLIHNDLHAANICQKTEDGHFYLFDFGLSMRDGEAIRSSRRDKGWCEYLAPERCKMELEDEGHLEATPAWDVYSFGCLLFLVLTGEPPFSIKQYRTDVKIAEMHIEVDKHRPWETIRERRKAHFNNLNPGKHYKDDCPSWLIDMVEKCLSKKPEERYYNANEFMQEFAEFLHNPTKKKPKNGLLPEQTQQLRSLQILVGIIAVIALSTNVYAFWGEDPNQTAVFISLLITAITVLSVIVTATYHFCLTHHIQK